MGQQRIALCIGINYPGTDHELRGCVNDANDWGQFLTGQGFHTSYMLDGQATRAAILAQMHDVISKLLPGDVGFVTYSGHGTWVPDQDGDEPDGRDEAICPIDMGDDGHNLIIDDEFHLLFNGIKDKAKLIFVTDSCHSGTVFRFLDLGGARKSRVRFLPPSHFVKSTPMYHRMERAFGQGAGKIQDPLPNLIHFSACRDSEYANDAEFHGRPNGAFTYYALSGFKKVVAQKGAYQDAWKDLRHYLPSMEYPQTPLLNAFAPLKRALLF